MWRDYLPSWLARTAAAESPTAGIDVLTRGEGILGGSGCCGDGAVGTVPVEQIAPCATLHPRAAGKRIERLGERVYCAVGYALSNVTMIAVEGGKVIVDATESCQAGREIKAAFDRLVPGPVKLIIYTHSHPDHFLGGTAFYSPGVPVWGHANFLEEMRSQVGTLSRMLYDRASRQYGSSLPELQRTVTGIGPALRLDGVIPPLLFPSETFRDTRRLNVGGLDIELVEAPGETRDHLFVHIPELRTVVAGDNVYRAFPNLYSVRGVAPRPVREWSESIDRIRWLEPEYVALGHTEPLRGREQVHEVLTAYRDAISHLHSSVVRFMNQGLSPDEMLPLVRLPEHLRDHPYLEQSYGCLEWGVRGIYEGYLGWFDGNATNLHPLSPPQFAERMIALAGGADKMEQAVMGALRMRDWQWAAQLCDILRAQGSADPRIGQWKAEALEHLAAATKQPVARNYYLSSAAELRGTGQQIRRAAIGGQTLRYMPLDLVVQSIVMQLRADTTANMTLRIGFDIPDAKRCYTLYIRRGVGEVRPDILDKPDFVITANEADFKSMLSGMLPAAHAIVRGAVKCSCGLAKLRLLRSIMHPA